MSKNTRQGERSNGKRNRRQSLNSQPQDNVYLPQPRQQRAKKPVEPKTEAQAKYLNEIYAKTIVFCRGTMGTGKTYIAAAAAAEALYHGEIERIIVTRPSVEAEEEYGHLPGELEEKWAPFFAPVRIILEERLGAGAVEMYIKNGKIQIAPLGFLRGHTFKDAFVIFDEAQNSTPAQMKLFLTRIGENCKVVVDGDPDEQKDIQGLSGFEDAWNRMKGHPEIGYVTFDIDDIVRSGIAKDILLRYRKAQTVGQAELENFLSA